MKPVDGARLPANAWLDYLEGRNPGFPERALRADLERIRDRAAAMESDPTTPETRLSDDPMVYNPCSVGSLLHLMLGGIRPQYWGGVLHCRVRYFDPERCRAGLPPDVSALVETITADETTLTLVNLNSAEARTVILQAGAYGEHRFTAVMVDGCETAVGSSHLTVTLEPGAGAQLVLGMRRYANPPTLAHPWPS